MSSDAPAFSPAKTVTNLTAIVILLVAGAYLVDKIWIWWGAAPFALCWLLAPLTTLAATAGLIMAFVGFVSWAFSGFTAGGHLGLLLGGLVLPQIPGVFLHYLGAAGCG